jgi:hypothetical protein
MADPYRPNFIIRNLLMPTRTPIPPAGPPPPHLLRRLPHSGLPEAIPLTNPIDIAECMEYLAKLPPRDPQVIRPPFRPPRREITPEGPSLSTSSREITPEAPSLSTSRHMRHHSRGLRRHHSGAPPPPPTISLPNRKGKGAKARARAKRQGRKGKGAKARAHGSYDSKGKGAASEWLVVPRWPQQGQSYGNAGRNAYYGDDEDEDGNAGRKDEEAFDPNPWPRSRSRSPKGAAATSSAAAAAPFEEPEPAEPFEEPEHANTPEIGHFLELLGMYIERP